MQAHTHTPPNTPHCRPYTYAPMHIRVHMHAHTRGCVRAPKTPPDTPRRRYQDPPSAHTWAHACTCIRVRMYAYTGASAYVCTRTHARLRICMHTRPHTRACGCTHASTPGTTAPQRHGEELMQTPEASHISHQPHLASPMLRLHCTHFLRPQYPSTPPPLFPSRRERRSPSPRCRMWLP